MKCSRLMVTRDRKNGDFQVSNNVLVSIVIVNYNGKQYVDKCINSILNSDTSELEIIIVDNGSVDGSIYYLKEKYGEHLNKIHFVNLGENYGPSKARNAGVRVARGHYIGFLDNDTEVHKEWATIATKEFKKDSTLGIIQCKLLLAKERNKIDYVGDYLGQNGFLVQRSPSGVVDKGQYDQEVLIFTAKSAGMFIKKETFDKIGGFDDDYFIYVEETDLGWRSWLAGYKVKFIPESIVYHEFGTSTLILGKSKSDYNAKFHGTKNYILTLFKNLSIFHLFTILPVHIFLWLSLAWFSLFIGNWKPFVWIHKGVFWNICHIRKSIAKRKKIQKNRVICEYDLFKIILQKKPLSYFIQKVVAKKKIGNAEGFLKSKL